MTAELQALGPTAGPSSAAALVERLGLWDDPGRDGRPRVVAAMIGSADGRATVDGRAGGLGSPADRAVLRALRAASDAVLVGSATLVTEGYATLLDLPQIEGRVARGRAPQPLLATISRRLDPALEAIPLFAEPGARIQVYTEAERPAASRGAQVATHAFPPGTLSPRACLEHLAAEGGVRVVVSEGGPTLLRDLLAAGLVDDLVLTVAPLLVAGEGRSVIHGPALSPPARLELRDVMRGEDHLFLHYRPVA